MRPDGPRRDLNPAATNMEQRVSTNNRTNIQSLPEEILLKIFSELQPRDLRSASDVSNQWRDISLDNMLLKEIILHHFPSIQPPKQFEGSRYEWVKKEIEKSKSELLAQFNKYDQYKEYGNWISLPSLLNKIKISAICERCKRIPNFKDFEKEMRSVYSSERADSSLLLQALTKWEHLYNLEKLMQAIHLTSNDWKLKDGYLNKNIDEQIQYIQKAIETIAEDPTHPITGQNNIDDLVFHGTLVPKEIGKLKHLQRLGIHGYNLFTLPPEIGNLTQLKEIGFLLYLPELPKELGLCYQLRNISLPIDKGVKSIPLEVLNLPNLSEESRKNLLRAVMPDLVKDT